MENTSNITYKFTCEKCKFFCAKKGDYNRHINTKKHINNIKGEERLNEYRCNCGKIYKHHSSLWNQASSPFRDDNCDYFILLSSY